MKNKIGPIGNKLPAAEIGRRDMLKKAGKYAAFTSATLYLVLSPKAEANQSPLDEPGDWNPTEW